MKFIDFAKKQFEDWNTHGKCGDAERLNAQICSHERYFDETNPSFFYGDLSSPLVLIHLNPKRNKNDMKGSKCNYENFEHYLESYTFFGKNKYRSLLKDQKRYDKFDLKQIRFLNPFGILPFQENNKDLNLEIVMDRKLQIDLIPYGSPSFEFNIIGISAIQPYFDRLFELILSYERRYIIFCGVVFKEMDIPGVIKKKSHKFKLLKKDGSFTQKEYELINLVVDFNGKMIPISIAPHFAVQGIPIDKYGEKITQLYQVY
jgi:hypothetical protein